MLEGKEVEGKIGSGGSYSVDVDALGMVRAEAAYGEGAIKGGSFLELDVIEVLRQAAKHTENQLDDSAIDGIAKLLGR